MKILFTADLHGNIDQYELLFLIAPNYDLIIIGGDLTPKDKKNRTIESQRKFLENYLVPKLKKSKTKFILLMGNDDFAYNESVFNVFKNISNVFYTSNGVFTIEGIVFVCYSYVPLTPFKFKDWEKVEFDGILEKNGEREFTKEGFESRTGQLKEITLNLDTNESIYNDLSSIIQPNCVLITHSPPFNTCADSLNNKKHVGSQAIRKIIEENIPRCSFHGHIHETVNSSGMFVDNIGKTKVYAVGNYHTTKYLVALESINFENVERIKVGQDKKIVYL
jgi:Icc-related predicted phosphoesterase